MDEITTKAFRSQNIITSNVAFSQELLGSVHWSVMGYKKKICTEISFNLLVIDENTEDSKYWITWE